jgi:regulator of sigma E protease
VLNVFLGWVCYVGVFKMGGIPETPAWVGEVAAGGPAYEAGMRSGDEILSIDGKPDVMFSDLTQVVAHSADDQVVEFVVRRPGAEQPITLPIEPVRDPILQIPTIRVSSSRAMTLVKELPYQAPPGLAGSAPTGFEGGDEVVRVGPEGGELVEVMTPLDLDRVLAEHRAEPLRFVVSRVDSAAPAALIPSEKTVVAAEEVTITVPPSRFVDLGFAPTMGKITALRDASPAEKAGLRVGDRIARVNGEAVTDPLRLPSVLFDAIGQAVELEIRRPKPGDEEETLTVLVTPEGGLPWNDVNWFDEPLNLDAVGAAVELKPVIGWVRPGSPAEKAGLKPGNVLQSATVTPAPLPEGTDGRLPTPPEPQTLDFGPELSFASFFDQIQQVPLADLSLRIEGRQEPVKLQVEPVDGWYNPRRGLVLDSSAKPLPPLGLAESVERGTAKTIEAVGSMYRILQSLAQRRVGTSNIAGPIRIASVAYTIAGRSLVEFLMFIGMISLNLAVVNFLPIPPLDGGKMVFLIGEAVRGRPLPESWQIAFSNVGVIFVLGLMVFVVFQDVILTFFS